ncbi:Transcription termination factor, mitochondrial/chloroplastic [Sesbania bispinosa]|nr:Transcription termination factor, mitochondrial/chloroplastic [Sesbania bispinosa]
MNEPSKRQRKPCTAYSHIMRMMLFTRHLCSSSCASKISKIPSRYKKVAVSQAQQALTDYLHATRCLPYAFADQIAKNSFLSLSNLIAKLGSFSPSTFSKTFDKFLRYNPINEFEFFFESIGIHHTHLPALLPHNKFFFSEDGSLLDAACALSEFGFPWDRLGLLYMESSSVFSMSASDLKGRLCWFKRYGFSNVQVVGICFAFPFVFGGEEGQLGSEIDGLLTSLKLVFLDFDLAGSVEGNVEAWHEVCRKIKVFYDLNGDKGFGENAVTMKILSHLHGSSSELQQRFDCLLHSGIEFSKLSKLVRIRPKILSQSHEIIEKKINFLCKEMGSSIELLDTFPAFLCFDLENRIKPRYRFHMWAIEKGLCTKNYSIASMIATSDKNFVARTFKIHPAAPKHWFEQFYLRKLLV